jgi:ubiquinone/menaquinone biosynthesis C-methylase UbiE
VGIDPSARFIEEALRRARVKGLVDRLEFGRADGAALPFAEASFDLVVASAVFGHVPNRVAVLHEMVRVARPGGTVAVFDHDIDTIVLNADDRELTRRIVHAYCDRYFANGWAGRELYAMFRQANLEAIRFLPLTFASTEYEPYWKRMVERLSGVARTTGAISDEEATAWRAHLEQKGREGLFFASRGYYCLRGSKPSRLEASPLPSCEG